MNHCFKTFLLLVLCHGNVRLIVTQTHVKCTTNVQGQNGQSFKNVWESGNVKLKIYFFLFNFFVPSFHVLMVRPWVVMITLSSLSRTNGHCPQHRNESRPTKNVINCKQHEDDRGWIIWSISNDFERFWTISNSFFVNHLWSISKLFDRTVE